MITITAKRRMATNGGDCVKCYRRNVKRNVGRGLTLKYEPRNPESSTSSRSQIQLPPISSAHEETRSNFDIDKKVSPRSVGPGLTCAPLRTARSKAQHVVKQSVLSFIQSVASPFGRSVGSSNASVARRYGQTNTHARTHAHTHARTHNTTK
jgi:hypothetical protein